MGYSAADESFTHQLPRPFDEVHHPDSTWSDRCYFFAASPDGSLLLASGYGNNPNTKSGLGYVKVPPLRPTRRAASAGWGTRRGGRRPDAVDVC